MKRKFEVIARLSFVFVYIVSLYTPSGTVSAAPAQVSDPALTVTKTVDAARGLNPPKVGLASVQPINSPPVVLRRNSLRS